MSTFKPEDYIGKKVNGYLVEEQCGEGAFSIVYKIRCPELKTPKALKVYRAAPEFGINECLSKQVAKAEAEILDSLNHPNILKLHYAGLQTENPFIIVDFMPNTLRNAIEQKMPLLYDKGLNNLTDINYESVLQLITELLKGVYHAHSRGIVHKDIKPKNILIAEDGTPILTDFNLATKMQAIPEKRALELSFSASMGVQERLSAQGGTEGYKSPEQIAGKIELIGPRTDLYAIGNLMYELFTGKTHQGKCRPASQVNPSVPKAIDQIIDVALQNDPEDRFVNASQMIECLQKILNKESPSIKGVISRIFGNKNTLEEDVKRIADFKQASKEKELRLKKREETEKIDAENQQKKARQKTEKEEEQKRLKEFEEKFRKTATGYIAYQKGDFVHVVEAKKAGTIEGLVLDSDVTKLEGFTASLDGKWFFFYRGPFYNNRADSKGEIACISFDGTKAQLLEKIETEKTRNAKGFIQGNTFFIRNETDWYSYTPKEPPFKVTGSLVKVSAANTTCFDNKISSPDDKYELMTVNEEIFACAKGDQKTLIKIATGKNPQWIRSLPLHKRNSK